MAVKVFSWKGVGRISKSLKKNAVVNCIRIGANALVPMLVFPYISRVIGPVNLGKVSFSTSTVNYFVMLASLGVPAYGVLVCSKVRDDLRQFQKTICELLYINLSTIFASYILFFVLLFAVPRFHEALPLMLINSILIFGTSSGLDWIYGALEDYDYIAVRSIAFKFLSLILIFLFVKKETDYLIYAGILVFSSVGSNVLNVVHARNYIRFFPLAEVDCRKHLKPIFALFAASIAGTISANTDTLMLGFMQNDYEVGIYNFAVKIKSFLTTVMTAILGVCVPRFSHYVKEKAWDEFRQKVRMLLLLTLAIAFGVIGFVFGCLDDIILLLGGTEYLDSRIPCIILTACVIVLAFTWTLGVAVLQPMEHEIDYTKGLILGCPVNVLLNALLIPHFGVAGAALATLASETVIACSFHNATKSFLEKTLTDLKMLCLAVPAAVGAAVISILSRKCADGAILSLVICFAVYSVLYSAGVLTLHLEIRNMVLNMCHDFLAGRKRR